MTDFLADAEARYRAAVERRAQIQAEWEALECPLLDHGSTGQLVEHPLVKMMREHDVLVDRLSAAAKKAEMGRPPTGVIRGAVGKSPATKLKRVV